MDIAYACKVCGQCYPFVEQASLCAAHELRSCPVGKGDPVFVHAFRNEIVAENVLAVVLTSSQVGQRYAHNAWEAKSVPGNFLHCSNPLSGIGVLPTHTWLIRLPNHYGSPYYEQKTDWFEWNRVARAADSTISLSGEPLK